MSEDIELKKKQIKEELEQLQYEFKIELPKVIADARAYGDLKENAEYHAARERQSFVKARIGQLSEQLAQLDDIDVSALSPDKVGYGSTVTVIDEDSDDEITFTFVSSNEVNPSEGKISLFSPVGVALQNKQVGDNVEVIIPAGKRNYYIEKLMTIHGNEFEKKKS